MTTPDHELFPYVAVSALSTSIHPSTGRLLTLDAVTFDDNGQVGEDFHAVLNPVKDAGPHHLHNREKSDFAQAPRFARYLKTLNKLIDGRTLILLDSPTEWGYLVSEARRAMNAAARANRQRARKHNRRRQRVGHVPRPEAIVDLLGSARRQGHIIIDERLNAVAGQVGVLSEPATATIERASVPEEELSRAATLKLVAVFLQLRENGTLTSIDPEDLKADRFGLQRSALRVDAHKREGDVDNPGIYTGEGLKPGMEISVSDDVAVDPDELIQAALDAGLNYQEKLTRTASLVVSDAPSRGAELRGKAMHAHRKDIPVLSAQEFLQAVARD
ncbi:DNA polymerase III subunit epsilon [Corynebacterium sp. NML140438]|uniref:DNA polymerase III subunit epsilon n=1 Tax=Corynebacterium sp. NML140438 TaxID=1906334 RepID=UPI0008FB1BE7|nr:DNA polymerase III subunit epsilon [Corynebacterium sp. NML140438]OIR43480.1 DNA polymerase III subunit epsilon [Corynebacterium sp. NML140438]